MISRIIVAITLAFGASATFAQTPQYIANVDALCKQAQSAGNIPGMVVTVTNGNTVAFQKAYGVISSPNGASPNGNTVFGMGGLTQAITAFAVLQLAEQGKFKLDEPASKYVSDMPKNWKTITIRQFLDNSSGIPALKGGADWDEALDFAEGKPLTFTPGSQEKKESGNYAMLGQLIEKTSGMTYAKYVQDHIFAPAGMVRSGVGISDSNVATTYGKTAKTPTKPKATKKADYMVPVTGLQTSSNDLVKWEQTMFAGKLLNSNSYHQMFMPAVASAKSAKKAFALGWEEHVVGPDTIVYAGSATAFIEIDLHRGIAVIVLQNMDAGGEAEKLANNIMKQSVGVIGTAPKRRRHPKHPYF
ncbi:MAG TPA: serine hydrolase domain-containing protein [Fimbriimonadaceae bacterium]|jgi:CubicO group peptidase (beta-lactamase class C family)